MTHGVNMAQNAQNTEPIESLRPRKVDNCEPPRAKKKLAFAWNRSEWRGRKDYYLGFVQFVSNSR